MKANTGNAAIKANESASNNDMKPPSVNKLNKDAKHKNIAINACSMQMIRNMISQNLVITVLRLTLFAIHSIAFHQWWMEHPALHLDLHYFLEKR